MKNINPLFLLMSSIIILLISIFSFNQAKKTLIIEQKEYTEFKTLALKYNNQRNIFSNEKTIVKKIQNLLSSSNIRNVKIVQKNKKIIVKITSINLNSMQKFINKVLNEQFNITKLNISKDKLILEIRVVK